METFLDQTHFGREAVVVYANWVAPEAAVELLVEEAESDGCWHRPKAVVVDHSTFATTWLSNDLVLSFNQSSL